jgi:hypothetical protein
MSRPLFTVDSARLLLVLNAVGRVVAALVGGRDKTHSLESYHKTSILAENMKRGGKGDGGTIEKFKADE